MLETETDEIIQAERDHLTTAREALRRMREQAESLDTHSDDFATRIGAIRAQSAHATTFVSDEALAGELQRRVKVLYDDGKTPLFFGRIDHGDDGPYAGETYHIGRRHIADESNEPLVVDWRAPVSEAFYRATASDPRGVVRRRRFGFHDGELTSYEQERLDQGETLGLASELLTQEIERPRVGPMRDIVATIQPDQDALVRADLDDSLCIQGAPGTGKTAVGLHRAAYLLFSYPDRLRRSGVLVVGPNRAFLSYIAQVLPALGEGGVEQKTVTELLAPVDIRATDSPEAARVKTDARMAEVIRRALYGRVRKPTEPLVIPDGSLRFRIGPARIGGIIDELRADDLRYAAARERLRTRLAYLARAQAEARGDSPTESWVAKIGRSKPVKELTDKLWPAVDAPGLIAELLSDRTLLASAADGILTAAEQAAISWDKVPRTKRQIRWTSADTVLIDEAADLLERTGSAGHVVIDEAQDLTAMQARAVGRRARHGSVTVLGDLAQGTTVNAPTDWPELLDALGKPAARILPLTTGYRVPAEVIELANKLLPALHSGVLPAESVRHAPGSLVVRSVPAVLPALVEAGTAALEQPGSVGVIVANDSVAAVADAFTAAGVAYSVSGSDDEEQQLVVVPAALAKGLEFDHVIVGEPADIVAAEARGLHRLYVVLTRAVSRLTVLHAAPLPDPLG
ncbi:HelD family protein [Fodinicola acaciae]|uniref:HelD family protein n=1 Tax=Fodinicola acaciae TaxID=2681555 RepID=UPI0013D2757A|nr:AAA family ATPase [Fodinicola acaciae]